MRSWLSSARDAVRAQLWPLPTLALVVAVIAGSQLPHLDRRIDDHLPSWLGSFIFNGDAGAASTVLDAISSSLITVTSLTFSLTVVTLQLASSQFSPRLLRTFTRDLFVQTTLALFLATFVYSLAVLRLTRSSDASAASFVPRLSVTVAFLLAVASVFMLVLFLAHLTRTIRVESMLAEVHQEAVSTMRATLPDQHPDAEGVVRHLPEPSESGAVHEIRAAESGFLTRVDEGRLVRAARRADAVLAVDAHAGDFVVRATAVARAWARNGGELDDEAVASLREAVEESMHIGTERTAGQDVGFGLRQLTDVANKALSPGINDPTTAVHSLSHLTSLLCDLAERHLGPRVVSDSDDVVRLVLDGPSFAELVEDALTQPRRYGAGDPQVVAQLFRTLDALALRVPVALHDVVRNHLERLQGTVDAQDFDDTERALLADLHERVEARLVQPAEREGVRPTDTLAARLVPQERP